MAKNAAPKTPKIIMKIVMVFGRIWKCMKYLEKKGDNDILITASSFPFMNMAFKVNPKLRVFCVKDFRDCQAFTKMLFMTFSSDNIIDIDFYDVNMAFGMTATKPRVIKHFSPRFLPALPFSN